VVLKVSITVSSYNGQLLLTIELLQEK